MSANFRCGVLGLSAAENALIRTLFRLFPHGVNDFRWELVASAPYDAVLVDSSLVASLPFDRQTAGVPALMLGAAELAGLPNALTRPLRSELLEEWLLQTQRRLMAASPSLISPLVTPLISASATNAPKALPPEERVAPRAAVAARAEAITLPSATAGLTDNTQYKLLRWPPAAMLRNDSAQIRMATVLSRRAMKISELAQLSQQQLSIAHSFVAAMRSAGLLAMPLGVGPVRDVSRAPVSRPAHAWSPPKAERSLLSRIRMRLGI